MSPQSDELSRLLDRLDAELDSVKAAAAEGRARLHALTQDVRRAAGSAPPNALVAGAEHHSRLEEFASRFEANHPDLAATLRQLIDTLGKAGV
jgi:hypothetical protein